MGQQGKRHQPTEASRAVVKALSGYGIPQESICAHPDVSVSISTLHKYYRTELDDGNAAALGKIGEALFDEAVNKRNIPSLIFLAKTRLGLQEVTRVETNDISMSPQASAKMVFAALKAQQDAEDAEDIGRGRAVAINGQNTIN